VRRVDDWRLSVRPDEARDDVALLLEEADRLSSGAFSLLNCSFKQTEIDWHFDPQLGVRAPVIFSPDIDYRDITVAGNVKNIWELNRHQHLTVLANAYSITKDARYAHVITSQIDSWLRANPTLQGVNWHSPLELGIRLISWLWIERLLRGSPAHDRLFGDEGVVWPSVYWHQWLMRNCVSRGSSSNNHLIGELAGLFVASTAWPYFDESQTWQRIARRGLEREALRQTFPSGLNREQAFSYHLFVLELFIVAALEGERVGAPFSAAFKSAVRRMIEAVPLLTDVGGNLPRYGDADDALAVQLGARQSSRIDFLYRVTRRWLAAMVPAPPEGSGKLAADLLWSGPEGYHTRVGEPPRESLAFRDAGLYVLTSNRGTTREVFCVADAGPLGFLSMAAHGHSDALSFTLSIGGYPFIVDAGTFSYFLDLHWREYFRSTRAHNTMTISGESQSLSGGPFLWIRHAGAKELHWNVRPEGARLVAEHSGYTHRPGRPVHRRTFELTSNRLDVIDRIEGSRKQDLEWRLHFHPTCDVTLVSRLCRATLGSRGLSIALDERFDWTLARGADHAGWYSRGFNLREPTTTLVGTARIGTPIELSHRIEVN
jgi:hypothetical protein